MDSWAARLFMDGSLTCANQSTCSAAEESWASRIHCSGLSFCLLLPPEDRYSQDPPGHVQFLGPWMKCFPHLRVRLPMLGPALLQCSILDQTTVTAAVRESWEKWEVPPPLLGSLTSAPHPWSYNDGPDHHHGLVPAFPISMGSSRLCMTLATERALLNLLRCGGIVPWSVGMLCCPYCHPWMDCFACPDSLCLPLNLARLYISDYFSYTR